MILKEEYQYGSYQVIPCGPTMTTCNNAFIDLANRFDDILASSFDESPRGDKKRVYVVADNIMQLLANSFYSLTWLNAKYVNDTYPETKIDPNNVPQVEQASQAKLLRYYYDTAVNSFERWTSTKKF
jgi:hypothetical protein